MRKIIVALILVVLGAAAVASYIVSHNPGDTPSVSRKTRLFEGYTVTQLPDGTNKLQPQ